MTDQVKLKKDNGDGSFDIMWLEDEAEDTANLEDLKRLGATGQEYHREIIGKPWENHGKMGTSLENDGKTRGKLKNHKKIIGKP